MTGQSPRRVPTIPQDLSSEERRCLSALSEQGAFGMKAVRPGYLALARRTKGITLALSLVRAKTGASLVARGFADWTTRGSTPHLLITEAGYAAVSTAGQQSFGHPDQQIETVTILQGQDRHRVKVNRRESPLMWLSRRKGRDGAPLIAPSYFIAGERLRSDFEKAGLSPRMSIDWSRFGMGTSATTGQDGSAYDAQWGAKVRFRKAVEVMGPDLAGPVIDICCFLKGLESVERERGWKQRSAKHILSKGLALLAKHYGFADEARGPVSKGIMRVSADPR